jgi:hypothetical protein
LNYICNGQPDVLLFYKEKGSKLEMDANCTRVNCGELLASSPVPDTLLGVEGVRNGSPDGNNLCENPVKRV